MNKTERNEERKLSATYFNGIAITVMAVGFFAPIVGIAQTGSVPVTTVLFASGCFIVSVALHYLARLSLRGMEE